MYYINDEYFNDFSEYLDYYDISKEDIENEPEDWKLEYYECDTEKLVKFDAQWITERINEERFSEKGIDDEVTKICKALEKHIDFEALNKDIPDMLYPQRKKQFLTKQEVLEILK